MGQRCCANLAPLPRDNQDETVVFARVVVLAASFLREVRRQ